MADGIYLIYFARTAYNLELMGRTQGTHPTDQNP
jgi:hypothetical protein